MKKSYINPNTECIALQGNTMVCLGGSGTIGGDSQGDARAPQRGSAGSLYL